MLVCRGQGPISGHKSGPKGVRNAIYRHLLRVNRIFFSQIQRKRHVTSLQMSGQCGLKNICYPGSQALPGAVGGGGGREK